MNSQGRLNNTPLALLNYFPTKQFAVETGFVLTVLCQLSSINYQLAIIQCNLFSFNCPVSTVQFQLSNFNCPMSTVQFQLSSANSPISTEHFQLSSANYSMTTTESQLSSANYPVPTIKCQQLLPCATVNCASFAALTSGSLPHWWHLQVQQSA